MEELSPIYDDVCIRTWADNIRQMKIKELEDIISKKAQHIMYTGGTSTDDDFNDISRLTIKLHILKKT
jgi:hypothetical protein